MQVLNIQCKDCGKPCRSQTERELHTKRTGHAEFIDKVILGASVQKALIKQLLEGNKHRCVMLLQTAETPLLETETEMVEARNKIREDAAEADGSKAPTEMARLSTFLLCPPLYTFTGFLWYGLLCADKLLWFSGAT